MIVSKSISCSAAASCVLYIFPTKALVQNQLKTLLGMMTGAGDLGDVVNIYDGDMRLLLSIQLCYV
jgi:DEAD/DEAH box helicase domain-containing protein